MPSIFGRASQGPVSKFAPFSGYDNDVAQRADVIPLGLYKDGKVRFAWPEMAGLPGFERAQERLATEGAPDPRNPEAVMQLADDTAAAAGGAMVGGLMMPKPAGALGIFGGKLAKTADIASIRSQIEALQPRYQQLYGRPFTSPKPMDGPTLQSEMADLEMLQSNIASRESAIAAAPQQATSVPTVAAPPPPFKPQPTPEQARKAELRAGEHAEIINQVEANPYTQTRGPGGRFVKKAEEKRLVRDYYSRKGDPLQKEGPWGVEPLGPQQYQNVALTEQVNAVKRDIAGINQQVVATHRKLNQARQAGNRTEQKALEAEAARLREQLNAMNKDYTKLSGRLKGGD